ncbi:MAG: PmoA family protein [Pirellulales bacterium]|nr:PmoA family protein [Pirellulales bacterium]
MLAVLLSTLVMLASPTPTVIAVEVELPDAKPVPAVQVFPLPYDQASFQHDGRELTRYHAASSLRRPFWYPIAGPAGHGLTRMGHPRDPNTHSHHNSVWISHQDVGGVDFWADHGKDNGQIVQRWVQQFEDGDDGAWMLSLNAWQDAQGKVLMNEWRRCGVAPLGAEDWLMLIDLQLEAPSGGTVTLGQTPFGLIGVRMAKTIGVHDGGGLIRNSQRQVNEGEVFRKPARWVDYSGPVANGIRGGITLMDHPNNPGHPTPFHVRGDGWMGACLTLSRPLTVESGRPLRLSYGLWVHAGVPQSQIVEDHWQEFIRRPSTQQASLGAR